MDLVGIRRLIRDVADFPAPGILFRDVTPLLADAAGLGAVIDALSEPFLGECDVVAAVEARGFIFGAPVAHRLGVGFVPIRKPGKLPHDRVSQPYALEYGEDMVEIHVDAVGPGSRVLVVDDVLATGGTAAASVALIESTGATVVAVAFVIELSGLHGRATLGDHRIHSLLTYE